MEYVIPLVLVLILVGGFVTFMVLNATKKSGSAGRDEDGPPGMGGDDTPLGDTTEHAGEQTEHGTTARDPEGVTRHIDDPDEAAHVARPGEGEGRTHLDFPGEQPAGASRPVRTPDDEQRADEEPTRAAADAAPDEQGSGDAKPGGDDEPAPPASERLADRGF